MRQVPSQQRYIVIGDGRVAKHIQHYLDLNGADSFLWARSQNTWAELEAQIPWSTVALLCINDDQIEDFYKKISSFELEFVHFSGSFSHPAIRGFHPLMSFGHELYDKKIYEPISFIGSEPQSLFRSLFPIWENPYIEIQPDQKNLYHALCVLAGNGTTLIWEMVKKELLNLGVPKESLNPYLSQVTDNILEESDGRMTGPWYRDDLKTIHKNQHALEESPLHSLYESLYKTSENLRNTHE
ncbi:MAG: DUF2520 domain-containing protein [Pseudomonadota bacterium]